jgi:hypothetical protein
LHIIEQQLLLFLNFKNIFKKIKYFLIFYLFKINIFFNVLKIFYKTIIIILPNNPDNLVAADRMPADRNDVATIREDQIGKTPIENPRFGD